MKSDDSIRIAIAESSVIVRSGITQVLKRLSNLRVQPIEVTSNEALRDCVRTQSPDILLVNPSFGGYFDVGSFRESSGSIRIMAIQSTFTDAALMNKYDDFISIFDDADIIADKIGKLQNIEVEPDENDPDSLSQREREIVICVVKGMTNKEIAENLYLSIHTVITHRRNISRKLQIHSASGLTIYAIVNKLVELNEIKGL